MRRAGVASALVLLCAGSALAGDVLELRGASSARWSRAELAAHVAAQPIRVWDPYERKELTFEGFAMNAVLDATFGERWRKEEELLMTCSDGFQPSIPVARFLGHRAFLAFRRLDQPAFDLTKNDVTPPARVDLAPYYLVWANLDDPAVRAEGDLGWPYQLVAIEPVHFEARFPKLAPPPDTGAEVRLGFLAFRRHCVQCHSVNGEGGRVGPELNVPMNVTEYWQPAPLRRWILDPPSVRNRAAMPVVAPELADREHMVEQVIAYLTAMAGRKLAP